MATTKAATQVVRKFKFERATKNTFRFAEEEVPGEAPIIGTLYMQRFAFNGTQPDTLTVTVAME